MWSDNETRIDLLGFDHLVDALELVLTDPTMLPVTVGVAGDWGSGKTSYFVATEPWCIRVDGAHGDTNWSQPILPAAQPALQ